MAWQILHLPLILQFWSATDPFVHSYLSSPDPLPSLPTTGHTPPLPSSLLPLSPWAPPPRAPQWAWRIVSGGRWGWPWWPARWGGSWRLRRPRRRLCCPWVWTLWLLRDDTCLLEQLGYLQQCNQQNLTLHMGRESANDPIWMWIPPPWWQLCINDVPLPSPCTEVMRRPSRYRSTLDR